MAKALRLGTWTAFLSAAVLFLWSTWAALLMHNVAPFVDQWMFLSEVQKLEHDGLSLSWLVAPHNEHRVIVARPLYLIDLYWFGGRNLFLLGCIAVAQLSGGWLFVRAIGLDSMSRVLASGLACALLFCFVQYANFVAGFQVPFVVVMAAGAWAIWLFARRRIGLSMLLLLIATGSMANGFLAAVAMAGVALAQRRLKSALTMFGVTAALLLIYSAGLDPLGARDKPFAIVHPLIWAEYAFTYVGGFWWRLSGPDSNTAAVGALGMIWACLLALRGQKAADDPTIALAGIALFVALTAVMTGYGRAVLGIAQAHDSRYLTSSAYFWAATFGMWARTARPMVEKASLAIAAALAIALLVPLQVLGLLEARYWHAQQAAGALLLADGNDRAAVAILANNDERILDKPDVYERSILLMKRRKWSIWSGPS